VPDRIKHGRTIQVRERRRALAGAAVRNRSIDFQQDVKPKQNEQRCDNEDWQMFHSSSAVTSLELSRLRAADLLIDPPADSRLRKPPSFPRHNFYNSISAEQAGTLGKLP
jgi:hypothetical protein